MKKVAYIAGGILIGFVFSTTAGVFADTVKSVVGKKVTGEYSIVVDGKSLSEKGAVIDSRANVPARALSEALGADVQVSGKTITITSGNVESGSTEATLPVSNAYSGKSKEYLELMKNEYNTKILPPLVEVRNKKAAVLAESEKSSGGGELTAQANQSLKKEVADLNAEISKYESELALIEKALEDAK